jgi:hypothetical protein
MFCFFVVAGILCKESAYAAPFMLVGILWPVLMFSNAAGISDNR